MSKWYETAVFYHIYPLGALSEKRENDYTQTREGMRELLTWIPHMKALGCDAVYLGPIFESGTHGYDTTDYRKVDSRLGDNGQLREFVNTCHREGIRVVLDGVFNHTGRDFFAFRDIRENREESPYKDWYRGVHFGGHSPMGDGIGYEAWRGHWELPRLNPFHRPVVDYLLESVRFWIEEFGIDGIRLDCADCLEFDFLRELRQFCTGLRVDFWLMGEIIHGEYTRWANPQTLHSVTNYEVQKGLYSSHNDGNLHEIAYSLNRQFGPGGIYQGIPLYNFADNHDLNRLRNTVKRPEYQKTIYTILFTMPGVPSLYYGSEWGLSGATDRVTDWNLRPRVKLDSVQMEDRELMDAITALAKLRRRLPALERGDYHQLAVSSHQLAFIRRWQQDVAVVAVNCGEEPAEVSIRVPEKKLVDALSGEAFEGDGTAMRIALPPFCGRVLTLPGQAEPIETPAATATGNEPEAVPASSGGEPPSVGRSKVSVRVRKKQ